MAVPSGSTASGLNNATWMETLFHGFAQYSQTVNKFVSGALGGIASLFDLYGLYDTYHSAQPGQQRKTKLATYFASFGLNVLYGCGAVLKFMSAAALSAVAVGIDIVALTRISYITHQARDAVKNTKREMERLANSHEPIHSDARFQRALYSSLSSRLETEREHRFRSKVEVGYTVASAITSSMFIGGAFFPPLFAAGLALLITVKIIQFIDYRSDLAFSRWLGKTWDKIIGANKPAKVAPALDHDVDLTHTQRNPVVRVAERQSASMATSRVNNTFAQQGKGLTAGYTRLFQHGQTMAAGAAENFSQLRRSFDYRRM